MSYKCVTIYYHDCNYRVHTYFQMYNYYYSKHRTAINHNVVVFYLELVPESCIDNRFAYHFDPCYAFKLNYALCIEFTNSMRNERRCTTKLLPLVSYFKQCRTFVQYAF